MDCRLMTVLSPFVLGSFLGGDISPMDRNEGVWETFLIRRRSDAKRDYKSG
jgi:hypothetical protein